MPYGHLEELAKNPTVPNFKVARKELTLNDMAKIILLQTARETLDVLISEYGWATTGDVIKTYYLIDAELSTTW